MSITTDADWWRNAVIYQVYPKSWADSDGDGFGDIAGIRGRLAHLARLGVDAVWFSPWYTSPQADGGYDVADFRGIDPMFGDVADVEALVAEAHDLGIKVIVDIVPNHSSDQHVFFQEALASEPGSPAWQRYHCVRGADDGASPPNDWRSAFGGSRLGPDPRRLRAAQRVVVPAPVRLRPAGLQLGPPRRARGLRGHACGSGSTGASTASASMWPPAW